mmetsp:Transcript_20569/g.33499  ORF Transcript_20569/g.33499 Transcript_20569/m.33499 type:complete len:435 (-) Transcript_20569:254-1558(-)|eukprot:CAMPEP_0203752534 /NCGR_PEP_ID=MMETSP0098-20131031/6448_1 /ASSEMBLY_ACC=CAM_ASM_000208 /TAXON_ID=96639 /ORGANISM=" , Strain NY0313808BC1" /LENGTH=434 /DNA_ID=CAMNT_0050642745 /DNA_START=124 /DNA_END=1428 /DNA_ORIENTATION=-
MTSATLLVALVLILKTSLGDITTQKISFGTDSIKVTNLVGGNLVLAGDTGFIHIDAPEAEYGTAKANNAWFDATVNKTTRKCEITVYSKGSGALVDQPSFNFKACPGIRGEKVLLQDPNTGASKSIVIEKEKIEPLWPFTLTPDLPFNPQPRKQFRLNVAKSGSRLVQLDSTYTECSSDLCQFGSSAYYDYVNISIPAAQYHEVYGRLFKLRIKVPHFAEYIICDAFVASTGTHIESTGKHQMSAIQYPAPTLKVHCTNYKLNTYREPVVAVDAFNDGTIFPLVFNDGYTMKTLGPQVHTPQLVLIPNRLNSFPLHRHLDFVVQSISQKVTFQTATTKKPCKVVSNKSITIDAGVMTPGNPLSVHVCSFQVTISDVNAKLTCLLIIDSMPLSAATAVNSTCAGIIKLAEGKKWPLLLETDPDAQSVQGFINLTI